MYALIIHQITQLGHKCHGIKIILKNKGKN